MALVGPKPEREELVLRWSDAVPDYERRFAVLPGVTGLAQVSGCPDSDLEGVSRRVLFDLHYVEHRSFLLDLRTLVRTAVVVMRHPRVPVASGPAVTPERPVAQTASVKGATQ